MADKGFMVIGPIRECANQDPDLRAGVCNGPGVEGWNWRPWTEGRARGAGGDRWQNDEGPDSRFLIAIVKCVATKYPLDARRLYVGGISSGATMTNRALTFRSDFWAGGLPISGEWYVTSDDGTALSFDAARAAVQANPTKIFQGRVGPLPLKTELNPMIVISVWGGPNDLWRCSGVLCADYRPSTQAASNYFSSMPGVVHVSCTSSHGHMWPQINTQAFNLWALTTLAAHPKGTPASISACRRPRKAIAAHSGPSSTTTRLGEATVGGRHEARDCFLNGLSGGQTGGDRFTHRPKRLATRPRRAIPRRSAGRNIDPVCVTAARSRIHRDGSERSANRLRPPCPLAAKLPIGRFRNVSSRKSRRTSR